MAYGKGSPLQGANIRSELPKNSSWLDKDGCWFGIYTCTFLLFPSLLSFKIKSCFGKGNLFRWLFASPKSIHFLRSEGERQDDWLHWWVGRDFRDMLVRKTYSKVTFRNFLWKLLCSRQDVKFRKNLLTSCWETKSVWTLWRPLSHILLLRWSIRVWKLLFRNYYVAWRGGARLWS